jgi:hypothetical protein
MGSSPKRTENEIRDHLSEHLGLIEEGLTLIDKEVVLHNDKGAKGFLDIFARTADGKFLIIEVKRSDGAAREAIQELVKYIALLKQNMLVKYAEVRLMVASTEWRELIVPFSEFVRSAPYDCRGLRLVLGPDGFTERAESMELAPEEHPRRLSRRQYIWGFDNETQARIGIPIIAAHMREMGLRDFVILLLAISAGSDPDKRFLYFAQQELSFESYMSHIRRRLSIEDLAEFEAWLDDLTEMEDKVGEAAYKIWQEDGELYRKLKYSSAEIAAPEKARAWFAPNTLVSAEVFRFGRFEDDHITDEIIKAEILGEEGSSFYHVDISANLSSRPEMAALLAAADNLLDLNPAWRTAIHDLCAYASGTGAAYVRLHAFSNEDIILTVAAATIGNPEYIPFFKFEIVRADEIEQVFGTIEWSGRQPDLDKVLDDYFRGDAFSYLMLRHFGEHRHSNADLMAEMGLSYGIGRAGENEPIAVRVRASSIDDARGGDRKFLSAFLEDNSEFTRGLVDLLVEHDQEFAQLHEKAFLSFMEYKLEDAVNPKDRTRGFYWFSAVEKCDICKRDMSGARFMIDGLVGLQGSCMCAICFGKTGNRIAWGSGQLYERDERGWRLVGGLRPQDDDDEATAVQWD